MKNQHKIDKVFEQYPIDVVVHLAACAYVGESVKEPEKLPVTEDMPQNPVNPYGFTKLAMERPVTHVLQAGLLCALRYNKKELPWI